jgi:3-oxoacyl-[acyl-carrier protein] reductase
MRQYGVPLSGATSRHTPGGVVSSSGMEMNGKVAIVTGSTSGIGAAVATHMAAEGARVVVSGRSRERGQRVRDDILRAGGDAMYVHVDVSKEDECAALVQAAVERFGSVTTLVNNASATDVTAYKSGMERVETISEETFDRILGVGLKGTLFMCKHGLPEMRKAGGGAVVNVGAAVSIRGSAGLIAYTAAKGAIDAMTRAIAVEGAPSIRCNGVVLGLVESGGEGNKVNFANEQWVRAMESVHLTRLGRAEDIAYIVTFLASDRAEFITGTLLPVDGGLTCRSPAATLTAMLAPPS